MARFQPGQSGNPGGRPKEVEHVKELARQHTPEAIRVLATIMRDGKEPAAARMRAAEALLDRAWGKPSQQISGEFYINRDVRDLKHRGADGDCRCASCDRTRRTSRVRTIALDEPAQPTTFRR